MKKIKLFTFAYFVFFMLFTSVLFAQSSFDLTGTFQGVRKQYDVNHESFMQEFQYQYELKQDGDAVSGISTIYSENGDYADVKIRGMVVGNKFYFEEYEIVDQMKEKYSVWCYKMGELDIVSKDGKTYLLGDTKSYMSNYGAPCTGGYTQISKFNETASETSNATKNKFNELDISIQLYPNPTANQATISFELPKKDKVGIEVFDLSGRLVATPAFETMGKGNQEVKFDLSAESTGLYFVKLSIGNDVYSKELVKAAR